MSRPEGSFNRHVVADKVRDALRALRSTDAQAMLDEALCVEPNHPDLLCELGMTHLLVQREAEALAVLDRAKGGLRFKELRQGLADHFFCLRESGARLSKAQECLLLENPVDRSQVGIRVTACLIVKNEEKHLARCLSSIQGIADEVVVVDTGSTDGTIEIAKSFGAQFGAFELGTFEWTNDFSAARNASLRLATGHWILWIDADEELTPESKQAIMQARVRPQFGGYNVEIINYVDDREDGSVYVHSPIRMFRRLPGIEFAGSIHEQVSPSIEALGLPWARLDGARLIHHGYRPSEVAAKGKELRTITMLQSALETEPTNAFQWFNLANAYSIAGRYGEATQAAKEAIRLAEPESAYVELAYQILIISLSATGMLDEAIAACNQAEESGEAGMMVEFERAQVLLKKGLQVEALDSIDRCIAKEWRPGQTGDRSIQTHKRYVVRGQILAILGRTEEALAMYERALTVDPGYGPAHFCKGATLEKGGHLAAAAESYSIAARDPSVRFAAAKAEARLQLELGCDARAAECFATAWDESPEDLESWISWCDVCTNSGDGSGLLSAFESYAKRCTPSASILINWGRAMAEAGDTDRALQLFSEAIQREPENSNAYFNCGDLLFSMGMLHDAAHLYEHGLRFDPNNAEAWFTLGNSLAKLGISQGAMTSYEQVLRIQPDHGKAMHNLQLVAA